MQSGNTTVQRVTDQELQEMYEIDIDLFLTWEFI